MTAEEWFKAVRAGEVRSAYLFHGEEEGLKAAAVRELRATLPEGLEALNEARFEGNASVMDVIAACETLPLMAERRIVQVTDWNLLTERAAEADTARMAAYLGDMPQTVCLVLYCHGKVDLRRKLAAAMGKRSAIVSFDPLSDTQVIRWVQRQLKPMGATMAAETVLEMTARAGRHTEALTMEIAKLAAYAQAQGREEILGADVEKLVAPTLEFEVFRLTDEIMAGRAQSAMTMLNRLVGEGENRIGILAMLTRSMRTYFHVRMMMDARVPSGEMEKRIGGSAYVIRMAQGKVKGHTAAFLRGALRACVEADLDIKSGRARDEIAVERLVCALSQGKMPRSGIESA